MMAHFLRIGLLPGKLRCALCELVWVNGIMERAGSNFADYMRLVIPEPRFKGKPSYYELWCQVRSRRQKNLQVLLILHPCFSQLVLYLGEHIKRLGSNISLAVCWHVL